MNVHFIAIGGSAMHNLAIALKRKGINVTGSDDEIFEPSRTRLNKEGILPSIMSWHPERITKNLDAVILGMHAREDNPELLRAKELGIKVFSYPEYLYEQSKDKIRIVIGGSHGKTTITSMILHATHQLGIDVDYMVGAQLDGYDCMVRSSNDAKFMILEGDEYLSSPIDRRPKFHLYQPNIALISGIAMDHINVFKTFEVYKKQFDIFANLVTDTLIYNNEDEIVIEVSKSITSNIKTVPYQAFDYSITDTGTMIHFEGNDYPMKIFGHHNLQNLNGAMEVVKTLGVNPIDFLHAMKSFTGAGKRLEKVVEKGDFVMYKDFAHSPSKLKATTSAVKEQYPNRTLVACMELHTFSSLNKDFLPTYEGAMDAADIAIVYFNPEVVHHKKLPELSTDEVQKYFGNQIKVMTDSNKLEDWLLNLDWSNKTLLMMSSGNFDGIDFKELGEKILK